MSAKIHIGSCGWSYLNEKQFLGLLTKKHSSKLHAYAQLFNVVEINSTFYALPKLTTVEKWRRESFEFNPNFKFTVKAYKYITHLNRFGKDSDKIFNTIKEICKILETKIVLFQSPASFQPSLNNIKRMKAFFTRIEKDDLICAWEPRGQWNEKPELITELCSNLNLIHCVDPLRNEPRCFGNQSIAYFRLHGFGKPSMYNYQFSDLELTNLIKIIKELSTHLSDIFVFFNNSNCYEDSLRLEQLLSNNKKTDDV